MIFRKRRIPHYLILEETSPRRSQGHFWRHLFWATLIFLAGFFWIGVANSTEPGEQSLNQHMHELESGQLVLSGQSGYSPAVHLGTQVQASLNGLVAQVQYRQRFRNDSDQWREAVYLFPLADNAAVNAMEMHIGERVIRGEIHEKQQAQQIYTQAKAEGKKAALTEQQRPNMYTQKVANIAPGETIEVHLRYVQRLDYDNGVFGFYLPTTFTPRYMPGAPLKAIDRELDYQTDALGWARPTSLVPDAHMISPRMLPKGQGLDNPIEIDIELKPGLELADIRSRYHQIRPVREADSYRIQLGPVPMDRDFRLEWQPIPSAQPQAAVFREQFQGEDYALLMLIPPQTGSAESAESAPLPRDVIFILDTSGSMSGISIEQAKASLQLALDRIKPSDRFNLIEFNSNFRSLHATPIAATKANLHSAKNFVRKLGAGGGTNMAPALEYALDMPSAEERLKQIVFITDGAVGNEEQLFELIENKLGKARLFTIGIGAAPNSYFMTRAAEFGRGSYEFIGDLGEVQTRMNRLFKKLESAVLGDLQVHWHLASGEQPEQFPARIPDLYAGEPLILSAKAQHLEGDIQIGGQTSGQDWRRQINLNAPVSQGGIASVWARAKVKALMDERVRGRDEADVRADILQVALSHQLVTAYTSLVAVEQTVARPPEVPYRPGAVPNLVAQGQQLQPQTLPVAYPRTASWMPLSFLLGCLGSLIALINHFFCRRRLQ